MTRWRLTIEYDGGPFMGWQRQDHGPSVQQTLEEALEQMTGETVTFTASGRTDAGVHALAMPAHVDLAKSLTPHRLREDDAARRISEIARGGMTPPVPFHAAMGC